MLRRPPFAEDEAPSDSTIDADLERLWRARVAEAARRAADDLREVEDLHSAQLLADLEDLHKRLSAPPEESGD